MTRICPKCQHETDEAAQECPRCGIVFARYEEPEPPSGTGRAVATGRWQELFFPDLLEVNPLHTGARAVVWCVLLYLGIRFMTAGVSGPYVMKSFMHLINLPFHEAGHILFRPLGRFMTSLGGSLGQLMIPFICLVVLLLRTRDAFGSAVCLWWFGQNFIDLAPYINDARSLSLPLLGGNVGRNSPYGFHDWEFILKESGLLRHDHALAKTAFAFGSLLILLALVWGALELKRQFGELRDS